MCVMKKGCESMPEATEVLEWRGRTAVDADGGKLGKIEEIYLDAQTQQPEWALIQTGMFGGKSSFMPLKGATSDGDDVKAPYSKEQVKDAPQMDADGELSQSDESALYSHYGIAYDESRSESGLPEGGASTGERSDRSEEQGTVGHDTSGPTTDDAMTRSEEELRVGTASRESGRARLVKHVVTEDVTQTVPVQREEVRVEREPITDANRDAATTGGEITSEEHEVVLHEEEVVVDKQAVPKERVRLDKDVVTDEQQVSETLQKEQIETEGVPPRR
jgi:uncharacterized protein (TIGR02271 family)